MFGNRVSFVSHRIPVAMGGLQKKYCRKKSGSLQIAILFRKCSLSDVEIQVRK